MPAGEARQSRIVPLPRGKTARVVDLRLRGIPANEQRDRKGPNKQTMPENHTPQNLYAKNLPHAHNDTCR